jgi:hypothetical protein
VNPTAIESYAVATVNAAEMQHGSGYDVIDDPVANLGPEPLVELLFVSGEFVTEGGELRTVGELEMASGFAVASRDPKERVDA